MPSTSKATKTMLKFIPEGYVGSIYELGSGWGGVAIQIAKAHKQCSIVAYESSWIPYLLSVIRAKIGNYSNLVIYRRDFFDTDLSTAEVVVCYLYPKAMQKLRVKFENELPQGAYVITNTFSIPSWRAVKVVVLDDLYKTTVFLYQR